MSKLADFALNFRYAFRPRKPILVFRLVWTVLKTKFTGKAPLRYVDFSINHACNLTCEHCFAKALHAKGRPSMTVKDYARVAQECMKLGTVNFSFQGGEPLLCKDLQDIITACKPARNVISVTTNGTLLTSERVRQLHSWGVDILTVSLDSSLAVEHDAFRGMPGALEKAKAGIDLALAEGLNVTIGTVVTHANLRSEGIKGLIEFAVAKKTLLYFILPVPAGNWMANMDILLTDEDLTYIEEITRTNRYIRTDFQANLGPKGCGAAKEILYLTPHGDVLPCPFMHISFGNVLSEPVGLIRDRMLQNPYLGVYHQKCLVSTDRQFVDNYLSRTFSASSLPMPAKEAFREESCS
jgi:MoaA/NifB/PqqE/SkfB family radical SAM enzyme